MRTQSPRPLDEVDRPSRLARRTPNLKNDRFRGDDRLRAIGRGRGMLRTGADGPAVEKIQTALIDLGFAIAPNGSSGDFDDATARAVKRFQRESKLRPDGRVGKATLHALDRAVPPAGKELVRSAEYDAMYADGRLDVTVAVGYDEHDAHVRKTREVLEGLDARGYRPVRSGEKRALGLTGARDDGDASFFTKRFTDPKSKREVDAVVRLITPETMSGATARESFERALEQDEVVVYSGHARYGTGPDFDDIHSGRGNFVIDPKGNRTGDKPPKKLKKALRGRSTDLRRVDRGPDYQLLIMNGCTTENYLGALRDPKSLRGRTADNTDVISTTMVTLTKTGGDHAMRFLDGVTRRENNNEMLRDQNMIEFKALLGFGEIDRALRANGTYTESGFLENDANVETPK